MYPMPPRLKRHHHNMNFLMTVFTGGLWGIAWALITWDINRWNRRELARYDRELRAFYQSLDRIPHGY